jgi:hypothetical protein
MYTYAANVRDLSIVQGPFCRLPNLSIRNFVIAERLHIGRIIKGRGGGLPLCGIPGVVVRVWAAVARRWTGVGCTVRGWRLVRRMRRSHRRRRCRRLACALATNQKMVSGVRRMKKMVIHGLPKACLSGKRKPPARATIMGGEIGGRRETVA